MKKRKLCEIAPEGWRCTHDAGHDGPCAAIKLYKQPVIAQGVMTGQPPRFPFGAVEVKDGIMRQPATLFWFATAAERDQYLKDSDYAEFARIDYSDREQEAAKNESKNKD